MRHPFITCTLAVALAAPSVAVEPEKLTVESLFAEHAMGRRTTQHAWSPDGMRLTYVWDEKGEGKEEALWSLDPATGKSEILLRLAEFGEEDPELDQYAWSPRGNALLLLAEGDLYLLPLDSRKLRRLTRTEADEEDPSFSPDGARLAFVRGFDLYALDVATGRETRLTKDGKENSILNGTTSWVYWEEIWDRDPEAYWWSPDGSRIAFYRFDETPIGAYPLVDDTPLYPKVK